MRNTSTFNIYHVATNQFYPLYDDLIRGLASAIRDLGFSCSVSINRFEPSAINILVGSTIFASRYHRLPEKLKGRPYIVYQLEQLDDQHGLLSDWPEYMTLLKQALMVWDYGPSSIQFLRPRLSQPLAYVPPAYHPALKSSGFGPLAQRDGRDIDVLFYGSPHPRRQKILELLQQRGLRVVYLHSVFGLERDRVIARSKIVLNIHAWDALPILETVRLSFLLANKVFVVSEVSDHNPYGDGVVFAAYDQIVEVCLRELRRPQSGRDAIAERGFAIGRKLKQAEVARPAVEAAIRWLYERRDRLGRGLARRVTWAQGRVHESRHEVDDAMRAYDEANQIRMTDDPQSAQGYQRLLGTAKEFGKRLLTAPDQSWRSSSRGRQLLFVVSMPYSTPESLVQVLSMRPSWTRYRLPGVASSLMKMLGVDVSKDGLPSDWPSIELADLEAIAERWLTKLNVSLKNQKFVLDAGPFNILFIGLLWRLFPGARFLSLKTDPMEACFTAFAGADGDGVMFAGNQEMLARHALGFRELEAHWCTVIPPAQWIGVDERRLQSSETAEFQRVFGWMDSLSSGSPPTIRSEGSESLDVSSLSTGRLRWPLFASQLEPLFNRIQQLYSARELSMTKAELCHRKGIALYRSGDIQGAIECYQRVIKDFPKWPGVHNSLGFALQDLDRLEEAERCFREALALNPDASMARLNLGLLQLKLGQWEEGWDNYEIRWRGSAEANLGTLYQPVYPLPQWQGEHEVFDQHLLVVAEQGYGDTFQFSRYLNLACQRFRSVTFLCSEPTRRLMEWSFGERVRIITKIPADYSEWNFYSPMMSLPRAFGTRIDSIPCSMPTLRVPGDFAQRWRARIHEAAPDDVLRVGIAWAGRRSHQFDARRSLSIRQIEPLLRRSGIVWFSLQKWSVDEEASEIPSNLNWVDWTEELSDFADTAGLIEGLDLVITIDSAMAHLAASLSRPVWMMNRFDSEWRWLRRRNDSPWYPSMKIFNQPTFGDWTAVLAEVDQALADRLAIDRLHSG